MTCKECEKLKSKLKMMEISFELINDDRNKLIKDLTETELRLEKELKKWFDLLNLNNLTTTNGLLELIYGSLKLNWRWEIDTRGL